MTLNPQQIQAILAEAPHRERRFDNPYDPLRGIGCCGERVSAISPTGEHQMVPRAMVDDKDFPIARTNIVAWEALRCYHDFEYWCARCVLVHDKVTGREVPFVLNHPQRRVAAILERQRDEKGMMRAIILKARQWGCSTLVQMYMGWIQMCRHQNWHSLICAHVKDAAASIRGMYSNMLSNYPAELWDGDTAPAFRPFERSLNVREIAGRGCRVTIGSSEAPDAVRGGDYAMAHLSETAFWVTTPHRNPADFIRSVCGSVALVPDSLIVMESTANGVGNYFHREWIRCSAGEGDKEPIFVPWHEIPIYRLPVPADPEAFVRSWTEREYQLWRDHGCSLSQISWYRAKASEYASEQQMMAEFPTTASEAFAATGSAVFAREQVDRMRRNCRTAPTGEITSDGSKFVESSTGRTTLWTPVERGRKYVISVDIGGRSSGSDWSVIAVMRQGIDSQPHEVVAQWRGHDEHFRVADIAMALGRYYNNALLVVESNTLEQEQARADDPNLFVLNRIARRYRNVYRRRSFDTLGNVVTGHIGFHTNRATKTMLIAGLIEAVSCDSYIERDTGACDELATYEHTPRGGYAAKDGCRDDILMTRAIALHVLMTEMRPAGLHKPFEPQKNFW